MVTRIIECAALLTLICGAARADHVPQKEDLETCRLPNGLAVLGGRGTYTARDAGGYILRFHDASLHKSPLDGKPGDRPSGEETRDAILKEHAGDLYYSPHRGGSLLAWSGRIMGLGSGYLRELSGKKLSRPKAVYGEDEDGQKEKGYMGRLENVATGQRYLVETVKQRYALVRILEQAPTFAVVQWVYQPNGSRVFNIESRGKVPYAPRAKAKAEDVAPRPRPGRADAPGAPASGAALNLKDAQAIIASTKRHISHRSALIEALVDLWRDDDADVALKAVAIRALGEMRATAAAPHLARTIDTPLPGAYRSRSVSTADLYPCTRALVQIGKPGAAACMDEMAHLKKADEASRWKKEYLLSLVVVSVERHQVARLLVQDRIDKAQEKQERENLQRMLDLVEKIGSAMEKSLRQKRPK